VLEKARAEGGGSWVLGKVDVDANPRLAQALRVQGIPMVVAVVGGQLVEGFTGVLPEAQVRQYVDAVLKAGGVAVEPPEDPRLDAADDALMTGDLDAAEAAYKKILAESPRRRGAESGLAQVELYRRVTGVDPAAVLAKAAADPTTSPPSSWPRTSKCSAARRPRLRPAGRARPPHRRRGARRRSQASALAVQRGRAG
jgi:putative thioredoxin